MRIRPRDRFLPGFKKAINHQRAFLGSGSAAKTGRRAINDCWTGIYGYAFGIGKNNFAAIGDFSRIDRAMSGVQMGAIPGRNSTATFSPPITGHACEDRFIPGKRLAGHK
jgi:hypothetical protein